jgi:Flp pilus assembly protein TadG
MKPHRSSLRRFRRDQRGVAAIELALVTSILALSVLCVGDLGRFALQKTWATYAASAGAEYAVAHGFHATAITTAATSAAPVSGISVSPAPNEFYGCATATGVAASTQGAICPSNTSTGGTAGEYVSGTATMPFSPMFSAAGISYPSTLTATAVVRIQ